MGELVIRELFMVHDVRPGDPPQLRDVRYLVDRVLELHSLFLPAIAEDAITTFSSHKEHLDDAIHPA